ncbi:hypothetical protein PanWU01x14_240000, partial [Parasponia andersonii]
PPLLPTPPPITRVCNTLSLFSTQRPSSFMTLSPNPELENSLSMAVDDPNSIFSFPFSSFSTSSSVCGCLALVFEVGLVFFLGFGGLCDFDNTGWGGLFEGSSVGEGEEEEEEWKEQVKETDLVLGRWRSGSGSGSGEESLEWGSQEFKIGAEELLRSIFFFFFRSYGFGDSEMVLEQENEVYNKGGCYCNNSTKIFY